MNSTKIGYIGPGADGRPVLPKHVRTWSPGGFGCSNGCDGCYACKTSKRFKAQIAKCGTGEVVVRDGLRYHVCEARRKDGKLHRWHACEACANFEVHLHRERLDDPARAKGPYIVLVNFFADTFDKERRPEDMDRTLDAAGEAPQHTYVWLTKQAERLAEHIESPPDNWYCGLTIRNQADADRELEPFLSIPGNLWISYEPAIARVAWEFILGGVDDQPCGIIIGHDNRKGAPGTETLAHIVDCVQACKAAGIRWFVKQIWLDGVFLRASKPEEYAQFPTYLSMYARLPWSAPGE